MTDDDDSTTTIPEEKRDALGVAPDRAAQGVWYLDRAILLLGVWEVAEMTQRKLYELWAGDSA